jgi:hypothetical protein
MRLWRMLKDAFHLVIWGAHAPRVQISAPLAEIFF